MARKAQFGLDYGITNKNGKVSESEVSRIIDLAKSNNIQKLDTAQSYGSSEEVLGRNLGLKNDWIITSKLEPLNKKKINNSDIIKMNKSFKETLNRLNVKSLNTFMVHRPSDFNCRKNKILLDWLISLQENNLIKNIGISIYQKTDLSEISLENIQIIQLPLSVYDQRLYLDGTIDNIHSKGIKVQARSIFLQGIILQDSKYIPKFLSSEFHTHHIKIGEYLKDINMERLELALRFIKSIKLLDSFVVGVISVEELSSIIDVCQKIELNSNLIDFNSFSWNKKFDLDPRQWPVF